MEKTKDFIRSDLNKGALLNTNNDALARYKTTKKRMADINKISAMENRLDTIEALLLKIVEKLNDSTSITG